jgi:hypothetical protein
MLLKSFTCVLKDALNNDAHSLICSVFIHARPDTAWKVIYGHSA